MVTPNESGSGADLSGEGWDEIQQMLHNGDNAVDRLRGEALSEMAMFKMMRDQLREPQVIL